MKLKILILKYKSIQACLYVGSWQCSVTCGIGTRHRTVQCRLDKQKGVNPRRCSKEKRPKAVEQCSEVRCSDYEWRKSVWSEVSTVKKIRFFFFLFLFLEICRVQWWNQEYNMITLWLIVVVFSYMWIWYEESAGELRQQAWRQSIKPVLWHS